MHWVEKVEVGAQLKLVWLGLESVKLYWRHAIAAAPWHGLLLVLRGMLTADIPAA